MKINKINKTIQTKEIRHLILAFFFFFFLFYPLNHDIQFISSTSNFFMLLIYQKFCSCFSYHYSPNFLIIFFPLRCLLIFTPLFVYSSFYILPIFLNICYVVFFLILLAIFHILLVFYYCLIALFLLSIQTELAYYLCQVAIRPNQSFSFSFIFLCLFSI